MNYTISRRIYSTIDHGSQPGIDAAFDAAGVEAKFAQQQGRVAVVDKVVRQAQSLQRDAISPSPRMVTKKISI